MPIDGWYTKLQLPFARLSSRPEMRLTVRRIFYVQFCGELAEIEHVRQKNILFCLFLHLFLLLTSLCRDTYEIKRGDTMKLEQFYTYQEQTFDSFIGKLIKNEGKDARKEIARQAEHEISMSQLMEKEISRIASVDAYDLDKMIFNVQDDVVTVRDTLLGQAIASLPPKRRDVILLSYFLGKNDPQIGALLHLTPAAIRYRRQTTLEWLRKILEALQYEK